jgi:hypothetical protein
MKYGKTTSPKIHVFTDSNECICDLHINMKTEVSKQYAQIHKKDLCKNCLQRLNESDNFGSI